MASTFNVPDISCDQFSNGITTEVRKVSGVDAVNVDLHAKTVGVTGGDKADIIAAIDAAGYDVA